jgi:hypothetical protein
VAEYVIVKEGKCAIIMTADGLRVFEVPSVRDCHVGHLLEMLDRLPEEIGFLCNLKTNHINILKLTKAVGFDFLNRDIIKNATIQNMPDDFAGEGFQPYRHDVHLGGAAFPSGQFIVHRLSPSQVSRIESRVDMEP